MKMVDKDFMLNNGMCRGIVRGQIFQPRESVAKFNVLVKSDRKNPVTKKHDIFMLNFVIYGDEAGKFAEACGDGDSVLLKYHVESAVSWRKKDGLSVTEDIYVVDESFVFPREEGRRVPSLNRGFLECYFIDAYKAVNAEGIYKMNVFFIDQRRHRKMYASFIIYGDLGRSVAEYYSKGRRMIVEYSIQKSKRELKNGEIIYFTNRVVERVG